MRRLSNKLMIVTVLFYIKEKKTLLNHKKQGNPFSILKAVFTPQ